MCYLLFTWCLWIFYSSIYSLPCSGRIPLLIVVFLGQSSCCALFSSKRFEEVYEQTQEIWHSQNYAVTREYYLRSPFFPPISLAFDIYSLCRIITFYIRHTCFERAGDYKAKVFRKKIMKKLERILNWCLVEIIPKRNSSKMQEWREFEEKATYEHAHNEVKNLKDTSIK